VSLRAGAPAGARRPGHHPAGEGERGAVTIEAALAMMALTVVLAAVVWALGVLAAQLALGEASRAAARSAARGEATASVVAEARRLVPDAEVSVRADGDRVVIEARRTLRPPGLLARWGTVDLVAASTAAAEPA
jgi:hypothetical protein